MLSFLGKLLQLGKISLGLFQKRSFTTLVMACLSTISAAKTFSLAILCTPKARLVVGTGHQASTSSQVIPVLPSSTPPLEIKIFIHI